jgi:uncharacterized protein (DUF2235 family)
MPKNLVVFCDGTNNEIAGDASNVLRLYRMLVRDSAQIAYYDAGVGTIAHPDRISAWGRIASRLFDAAMGLSIRQHFLKAYRFLVRYYQPGDQIYLFGFSRGAYTVRALAGAIHRFGLIRPELEGIEDIVWAIYSGENKDVRDRFAAANRFKKAFGVVNSANEGTDHRAFDIPIHFMGVWDTVSAFGAITDLRTLPNTADNPSIEHIRHAVAIDERRSMFQANFFRPKVRGQHASFKEVWFAGVHSDVGGGYSESDGTLSKVSLNWMLREVTKLGLRIDSQQEQHLMNGGKAHPPADSLGRIHESLKGKWHLLELLPQRRYDAAAEGRRWHWPNFWRRRTITSEFDTNDQLIAPAVHDSVIERLQHSESNYKPRNLPDDYVRES